MPPPLLPHSYASASVVTDVLMKKYVDAMPLYRQEQMWKRMGVELKRGTMANWVIQVADLYLRPFWKRIRSELLTQSTIHADETVMQVLKEKGKPATSESRMWVYSSAKRADIQLRCFEYRESRSGKWAKTFLEGFSGVLITDGYSGYGTKAHSLSSSAPSCPSRHSMPSVHIRASLLPFVRHWGKKSAHAGNL